MTTELLAHEITDDQLRELQREAREHLDRQGTNGMLLDLYAKVQAQNIMLDVLLGYMLALGVDRTFIMGKLEAGLEGARAQTEGD